MFLLYGWQFVHIGIYERKAVHYLLKFENDISLLDSIPRYFSI
jgi:hypothetical protein